MSCGNYAAANALSDELVALADEKGALTGRSGGMLCQGWLLALTGKASDAVQMMTSGIASSVNGTTRWIAHSFLSSLATAYAELRQFDDAWRCIDEAMTLIEDDQGKVVRGRGQSHRRRNRTQVARAGCGKSRSVFRARARGSASTASQILGAARSDEHGAALARSGQAG